MIRIDKIEQWEYEAGMYSFRELQKACKKTVEGTENKLVVLGNCATQFLAAAIEGYAKLTGLNLNVFNADYNQIDAQLLDPFSEVNSFAAEEILLWLGTEKIYEEFLDLDMSARSRFADSYLQKIEHYWELISNNSNARIMQMNFSEIDDKVLGSFS